MIFDTQIDELENARTRIKVIGVGGAGKNALNHMIENEVFGVEFYAVNTDYQDLKAVHTEHRLLIGRTKTKGQGAGGDPKVGRAAALEAEDDIHEMIGDAQMVIITCGMGGGTGTGAAPVIAKIAKEHGCLTLAIVTKPFLDEGPLKMDRANAGIDEIKQYVDALIVIPNQNLFLMLPAGTSMLDALKEADNVLRKAVQGISEIVTVPGQMNVDFADIKSAMKGKGTALFGIGIARGANRAVEATRLAIHNQLLEKTINGATDAIVHITAREDVSHDEISAITNEIKATSGRKLNVKIGLAINNDLNDEIVVTVIATGYDLKSQDSDIEALAGEVSAHMFSEGDTYSNTTDDEIVQEPVQIQPSNKTEDIFSKPLSKRQLKKKEKKEKKKEEAIKKQEEKQENSSNSKKGDPDIPPWF